MNDTFARGMALVALLASLLAFGLSLPDANAPVDLAVLQPKFAGGIDVSSAGSTPGIVINAESTGVPAIRFLNAAGTEVANISSSGVLIAPAAATATP